MKKLLLATAAVLALTTAGHAAIISPLGADPTSASGNFIRSLPGVTTAFDDQYTFNLTAGTFFTIAGVQNSFAQASDFITNFAASVFNFGPNGVFEGNLPGHGDDVAVIIGGSPVPCQLNPACQVIAGSAFLPGGVNYYADISGIGGGTSGYQGGVAVAAAVPAPLAGAGLPGLLALFGFGGFSFWKRHKAVG